ncbi:protein DETOXIFICATION 20-like isoform X2 [Telopea speciosissima]|uniref:protein DETOXIFICATION 20-like isoform X2 n=1 Tax=Telopea speciosissima TaxID=54955 RepID=UPI001CC6A365|nr:protein DETOXIFICATION 20-like isoform X2 [Telopea speciosissima]
MDDGIKESLLYSKKKNGSELKDKIWEEGKKLWKIAAPTIVTRVSGFGILVVTQAYIGHIGEIELASFSIVQSIIMRFVDGILLGVGSSLPTVCGQAFGAGKYHMMGIYLQQSWIILLTASLFMLPAFIFTTPILRFLGEEEELTKHAGKLSLWFLPLFFYQLIGITTQTFLQAQLKIMIVGWASAISFVLSMILSRLMVDRLSWGVSGAMGAMNLSFLLILLTQFIYIFGGWCKDSWNGFSKSAFNELWPFLKLSISSGVMLCFEFWNGAVLVLLVGNMKNAQIVVSAFSICLNINAWVYMVSLGFLSAASVRVANELGKGDAKAAKFTIKLNLSISLTIGVIFSILALVYGKSISFLFTSSIEVAKEVSSLSVLLASIILLNSVQAALSGVAIGCGRQSLVACVNIFCYYVVGFPLGMYLGYVINLQVRGIWAGMICGTATQTLILMFITWRTDWDAQVGKTMTRFNRSILPSSEEVSSDITSHA